MTTILSVKDLTKTYPGGFQALKPVNLDIQEGEILALLGPNGAGKTTMISIICGLVNATSGSVTVGGFDNVKQFKDARRLIGLVPQELATDTFEKVIATVSFTRGLFGKAPDPAYIEKVLKDLTLWDKKDNRMMQLSGGMKRRVMIAKALSHQPRILFLDEPTAGVDVSLRKEMWDMVLELKKAGVTIVLTTHYIEEAEMIADRVGVIREGELLLVEEKARLMEKLGKKQLTVELAEPLTQLPDDLADDRHISLSPKGSQLIYTFDATEERTGIRELLDRISAAGLRYTDLNTSQSSLEDIFVELVETAK